MQWERLSLYKEISRVTGVTGKQLPVLKELKSDDLTSDELEKVIKAIRKQARESDEKAQCVMGFLCCLGFAKKKANKKLYGSAMGRLDAPRGPKGILLYAIGDDYYHVAGPRQDLEEAAYWYRRSAAHHFPAAQVLYGDCLFSGEGVEPDIVEAVNLYKEAAKTENPMALRRLGDCAYLGIGLEQNTERAVTFFRDAARLGCRDALWRLGDLYLQGDGVEKNVEMAISFYEEAADAGVASAMCMLGDRSFYGKPDKVDIDYKNAVRRHKKSAR